MRIKTDKGKEYDVKTLYHTVWNGKGQLMIGLGQTDLRHAVELDGVQVIEAINEKEPGIVTRYAGYSRLVNMARTDSGVRVTLEMEA